MTKLVAFLNNLVEWVQKVFTGLNNEAKILIPISIKVVTNINTFVDAPGCDLLTAIIPGEIDNTIQDLLKQYLPIILKGLNTSEKIAEMTNENDQLIAIVNQFQSSPDLAKKSFSVGTAAALVSE